jgi:hypothetical protein
VIKAKGKTSAAKAIDETGATDELCDGEFTN